MIYSFHTRRRQIPLPLALFTAIIFAIGLTVFFHQTGQKKKVTHTEIEMTEIGNLSYNMVTVFWRSKEETESYLLFGKNPKFLTEAIYDDRDKSSALQKRHNHVISVENLDPETIYYFQLVNNEVKTGVENGKPFNFKTAPKSQQISDRPPAHGKVLDSSGSPVSSAVILIEPEKAVQLIAVTKQDGTFLTSLCCLYEKVSLKPLFEAVPDSQSVLTTIVSEIGDTLTSNKNLAELSLGEAFVLKPGKTELASGNTLGATDEFLKSSKDLEKYNAIDLIYPRSEAQIAGPRPLFKGLAMIGSAVKGKILPEDRDFTVTADQKGIWTFSPSINLSFGKHSLVIDTVDKNQNPVTLRRNFFILESGSSVLAEATGSATLTPPTTSPTEGITEAPTATTEPTLPTTSITVSITPTAPITGPNIYPVATFSFALVIIGMGLIFIF